VSNDNFNKKRSNKSAGRYSSIPIKSESSAHDRAVVWLSNAPWAGTGYGQQTAQVTTRLQKENYKTAIITNYGLEGNNTSWNGIQVYQRGYDLWSNDIVTAHTQDWASRNNNAQTVLFTLFDVWVLKNPRFDNLPIASWVPIDHLPAPIDVLNWCKKPNVIPIAMSQFGKHMLNTKDIDCLYIPHAIEKNFEPKNKIANNEREFTGREFMGYDEDVFVVSMFAANKGVIPNRKAFAENLLAFSEFAKKHDDVRLYMHTEDAGGAGGIDLHKLLQAVGVPKTKYRFVDQYAYRVGVPQEALATLYTATDVLLACSMGEGFGIPVIEAQACGTPVIVSNFSAQPELVGDGWVVNGQPFWDSMQSAWLHTPNVQEILNALEEAYNNGRNRSSKAIAHAKKYDADYIFETAWLPALERIYSDEFLKGIPEPIVPIKVAENGSAGVLEA
jgi:glycosyltransferase involved in cell wall biosynthesis